MIVNNILIKLIVFLILIIIVESQDLTQEYAEDLFKDYPFGVRSSSGVYVQYSSLFINGTIFGFTKNSSVDFQENSVPVGLHYLQNVTDIVEDHLGEDGRPVYKYGDAPFIVTDPNTGQNITLVHNSSTFYQWFHHVPCVNYPSNATLSLAKKPVELVFLPTNYSYPYGTVQDPLPYFQHPTISLSFSVKGRKNIDPHISIITTWQCFFFVDGVKQIGAYLEGPGEEDVYYYDYRRDPLPDGQSLKIDLFCASRNTGNTGLMDISYYNTIQNFTCNNVDSCDMCGFDDTCGCNKGPIVGCSRANDQCMTCNYINDCGYVTNNDSLCQSVKCINNQTCELQAIDCDDGNDCTTDECSSLIGCTHTLCLSNDSCLLGTCINNKCNFKDICEDLALPSTTENPNLVVLTSTPSPTPTPTTHIRSPCEQYQHYCKPNQICIEDFSTSSIKSNNQFYGIPKCINIQKGCMNCNDLNCHSQGLSCKYIQENEIQNCDGKCKDIDSCCSYQPTCY